jgi:hypothetical protein
MFHIKPMRVFLAFALLGCAEKVSETEDESIDDGLEYLDLDGDGYSVEEGDCNDGDADFHPASTEVCDGVDNDCDGLVDDADDSIDFNTGGTYLLDSDADGYGSSDDLVHACQQPFGTIDSTDQSEWDCDDSDPAIHPAAVEICDGVDNDCDGHTDDGDDSVDPESFGQWYQDLDGDGYGDAAVDLYACDPAEGYVAASGDCDDSEANASPDLVEVCDDSIDNDCDGASDCTDEACAETATCSPWLDMDSGRKHSCVVDIAGAVQCWGLNGWGQSNAPVVGSFTQISAGGYHSCAIENAGALECWGWDDHGQTTSPTGTFNDVSAGGYHTCAIDSGNSLECWGAGNDEYDCGDGIDNDGDGLLDCEEAVCAVDSDCGGTGGVCFSPAYECGQSMVSSDSFSQVTTGLSHTCAIDLNGSVQCWGRDNAGQGTPPSESFSQVVAGNYHTCGLDTAGLLHCWGSNSKGQSSAPAGTFTQICAGYSHNCAVESGTGSVMCWGDNDDGQCGAPTGEFTHVSCGEYHSCAIGISGDIQCWGLNDNGQVTDVPLSSAN